MHIKEQYFHLKYQQGTYLTLIVCVRVERGGRGYLVLHAGPDESLPQQQDCAYRGEHQAALQVTAARETALEHVKPATYQSSCSAELQ